MNTQSSSNSLERTGCDSSRTWAALACLFMFVGVAAGAFGAHGLKAHVTTARLEVWQTAVQYHLFHGVSLLTLNNTSWGLEQKQKKRLLRLLLIGTVIFSGSLYCLVLLDLPWLGAVTPLGGSILLAGWGYGAYSLLRSRSQI